jgi:hypothetical protein
LVAEGAVDAPALPGAVVFSENVVHGGIDSLQLSMPADEVLDEQPQPG